MQIFRKGGLSRYTWVAVAVAVVVFRSSLPLRLSSIRLGWLEGSTDREAAVGAVAMSAAEASTRVGGWRRGTRSPAPPTLFLPLGEEREGPCVCCCGRLEAPKEFLKTSAGDGELEGLLSTPLLGVSFV